MLYEDDVNCENTIFLNEYMIVAEVIAIKQMQINPKRIPNGIRTNDLVRRNWLDSNKLC